MTKVLYLKEIHGLHNFGIVFVALAPIFTANNDIILTKLVAKIQELSCIAKTMFDEESSDDQVLIKY